MGLELLAKLNINQLRIFESVYRNKSMTVAAQELFLTQSGVSQHIKLFEENIDKVLFVRNRTMLFATEEADILYKACLAGFGEIEAALYKVTQPKAQELVGTVRIGIPTEFGNNIFIPFIAEWSKNFEKVRFEFTYGYGHSLVTQLESGVIDIALIDSLQKYKNISSKKIFEEDLNLVISNEYFKLKKKENPFTKNIALKEFYKQLLLLDFVEYENRETILRSWFSYHFMKKNLGLGVRAWAMSVQGVASLIKNGVGAGILPGHVTEKLKAQGFELIVLKGKKGQMKNPISVAWVKDRPKAKATEELLGYILSKV